MRIALLLITLLFTFTSSAKQIAETNELVTPLLNGQQVPNVNTVTSTGKTVALSDILAGKKTVLFFYRGGWCPFCNTQMGQLKAIEGQLADMGFQLIGISTDSPADLQKSINNKKLNYQLLSDYNSTVSQAFGLAYFSSQQVTDRYLAKMHLTNPLQKNAQGEARLILPAPAVYVIDKNGLVQFNYVNPNYKVRLNEQLLLLAAKLVNLSSA
jgi:peroxiredoxin